MAEPIPREMTQRELRNRSGEKEATAVFATAPVLDAAQFRADLDNLAEQDPFHRDW